MSQVRNAALGIVSRRILWGELTIMETLDSKDTVSATSYYYYY